MCCSLKGSFCELGCNTNITLGLGIKVDQSLATGCIPINTRQQRASLPCKPGVLERTVYTVVYLTIGGEDDSNMLQQDLNRLSVWESRWDMEFNSSKCQVVQVTNASNAWSCPGGCFLCKVLGDLHIQWPVVELPH